MIKRLIFKIIQILKENKDSKHIYHFNSKGAGYYGIMLKQSNYYIFAYIPDSVVFESFIVETIAITFIYLIFTK